MAYIIREWDRIKGQDNFESRRSSLLGSDVTGSPGPRGDVKLVFVVVGITDLGGKHFDHVLLVDKRVA